jgi:segregation and condensation protein B
MRLSSKPYLEWNPLNEPNHSSPESEVAGDYSTMGHNHASGESDISFEARVEALLYVSPSPVTVGHLATALRVSNRRVEQALENLAVAYQQRGIRLQFHHSEVQLTTAPELATDIERFLDLESVTRLTRAALEVLAIIAYQQPVTRPQIDSIRGVNSDSVLRTLLRHGLIEDVGRSDGPGRPILYTTTAEFLQHFGLSTLHELPQLSPGAVSDAEGNLPESFLTVLEDETE